jgi:preprotein translocase subunit SecD
VIRFFPGMWLVGLLACSSGGGKAAAPPDWQRVPVSIEFRLAKGAPGPDLVPAAMYGQGDTVYLDRKAQLSNSDIARVEAEQTRIGKGLILHVWHTKAGAQRIADLTAHHIGDSLAILINSVVVAIPTIQQPLNPGTRMPSDIGVPLEPKEAMQLAAAISKTWPRKANR